MGHIPPTTRTSSPGRVTIALTLAVMLVLPGVAVARRIVTANGQRSGRFPVMGCNARGADPSPAPIAAYAPSRCYLSRVGPGAQGYGDAVNLQSIDHVRWAHWGAATATGRGDIVSCGTGCTTARASMAVYGLTTSRLAGGKAYTRLRVSFSASYPTKHTATVIYNVKPVP